MHIRLSAICNLDCKFGLFPDANIAHTYVTQNISKGRFSRLIYVYISTTYLKTTQRNLTTERDHSEWTIPPVFVRKYLYNLKKAMRLISEN